jgi:hypothetical protein
MKWQVMFAATPGMVPDANLSIEAAELAGADTGHGGVYTSEAEVAGLNER